MNFRWKCFFLLIIALSKGPMGFAQEPLRPTVTPEFWSSFGLQGRASFLRDILGKDIAKRTRTGMELGYRSTDAFFAGNQVYMDLSGGYKLSDHITVGAEYRYAYRSADVDRQRLCALFEYATTFDRLELAWRFDYQHNFRPFGEPREVLRNKFTAGYNIPDHKLDPKFSVEFFQWAGHQGLIYFGTRYKLGTEWSPKKGHTLGFGVIHDRERMVFAPTYRVIASIDYTINLRKN
ncbi:MAG: DUF2490 domain-containing protein [Flavobacteriales bacterium]|nr:DUF2490 domain-containing protein [Flavobacteriales bacterium]